MSYLQPIEQTVTTWENMSSAPHRFNAREFNLSLKGKIIEVGHLHSGTTLDILFNKALRQALVAEGKTEVHHILPNTGWTTTHIRSEKDVPHALWLLRLSYLQKAQKSLNAEPLRRELDDMQVSDAIRAAGFPHLVKS